MTDEIDPKEPFYLLVFDDNLDGTLNDGQVLLPFRLLKDAVKQARYEAIESESKSFIYQVIPVKHVLPDRKARTEDIYEPVKCKEKNND